MFTLRCVATVQLVVDIAFLTGPLKQRLEVRMPFHMASTSHCDILLSAMWPSAISDLFWYFKVNSVCISYIFLPIYIHSNLTLSKVVC